MPRKSAEKWPAELHGLKTQLQANPNAQGLLTWNFEEVECAVLWRNMQPPYEAETKVIRQPLSVLGNVKTRLETVGNGDYTLQFWPNETADNRSCINIGVVINSAAHDTVSNRGTHSPGPHAPQAAAPSEGNSDLDKLVQVVTGLATTVSTLVASNVQNNQPGMAGDKGQQPDRVKEALETAIIAKLQREAANANAEPVSPEASMNALVNGMRGMCDVMRNVREVSEEMAEEFGGGEYVEQKSPAAAKFEERFYDRGIDFIEKGFMRILKDDKEPSENAKQLA